MVWTGWKNTSSSSSTPTIFLNKIGKLVLTVISIQENNNNS